MFGNTHRSFFAGLRRRFFRRQLNQEIMGKLFPHLEQETDHGYPFLTPEEMNAQTEQLEVRLQLERIEQQIQKLPRAYGECFRHILHRDLHQRLSLYARVAERETPPATLDPRFVATPA
jgi:hypothetical protein